MDDRFSGTTLISSASWKLLERSLREYIFRFLLLVMILILSRKLKDRGYIRLSRKENARGRRREQIS